MACGLQRPSWGVFPLYSPDLVRMVPPTDFRWAPSAVTGVWGLRSSSFVNSRPYVSFLLRRPLQSLWYAYHSFWSPALHRVFYFFPL